MASTANVIDAIRTLIPTVTGFSDKIEIPNPYLLEDNKEPMIRNSWGLIVGGASRAANDDPVYKHYVTSEREMSIVLTRKVYDLDSNNRSLNTAAKSLLDDKDNVVKELLDNSKILETLKTGEEVVFNGDSGIEFLIADNTKFIKTQIDFTIEMVDQIN